MYNFETLQNMKSDGFIFLSILDSTFGFWTSSPGCQSLFPLTVLGMVSYDTQWKCNIHQFYFPHSEFKSQLWGVHLIFPWMLSFGLSDIHFSFLLLPLMCQLNIPVSLGIVTDQFDPLLEAPSPSSLFLWKMNVQDVLGLSEVLQDEDPLELDDLWLLFDCLLPLEDWFLLVDNPLLTAAAPLNSILTSSVCVCLSCFFPQPFLPLYLPIFWNTRTYIHT